MPFFRNAFSCLRFVISKQTKMLCLILVIWLLVVQMAVFSWLGKDQNEHRTVFLKSLRMEKSLDLNPEEVTKAFTFTHTTSTLNSFPTEPKITAKITKERRVEDTSFIVIDSVSKIPDAFNAQYVLVIPQRVQNRDNGLSSLNREDQRSVRLLGDVLISLVNVDGATCLPRAFQNVISNHEFSPDQLHTPWHEILNTSWCNFARRDWSIQIRNTGRITQYILPNSFSSQNVNTSTIIQWCNIINGPFVLRKEIFAELKGLRPSFGRLSILDFFLRSKGKLKIAKFGNCFFSDHLFHTDRAELEGSHDFTEYSKFGVTHDILRIIMEDKIEWTRCTASGKLCIEKPYTPPTTLPQVGQPICCSVLLSKMLKDLTQVFVILGIKHIIAYGTLLGAVRSKTIIPWTHDVDISLERHNVNNLTFFAELQKHFTDKYYIGKSFMGMLRMIPLIPPHINIRTSAFFKGDNDTQGDAFFSPAVQESVQGLFPILNTWWRGRGYVDFYAAPEVWWNGSAKVTIDGHTYHTLRDIDYELKNWYGNYMKPALTGDWNGLSDQDSVEG